MLNAGVKWMFLIIGATIGAGYASGQELWQFFGYESGLAILLFAVFFSVSCYVIMNVSYHQASNDYLPVLQIIVGKRLSKLYDVMIFLYLSATTVVMIAGSGATGQAFNIPFWWGVLFMAVTLIILFFRDISGLLTVNQLVLPLLLGGLLFVLLLFIKDQELNPFAYINEQRNWTAAFPFTALNILPLIAVLGAVGHKVKSKREIYIAAIGSGLILGILSFIYNSSLIQIADELLLYEIPLFAILNHYSFKILIVMTILLWFAIFTTAASGILGMVTRIQSMWNAPTWMLAALSIAVMIPLTTLGFSTLINYIYPVYGILNLYVLTRLLLYPLWRHKVEEQL
ncbi:membrane protein [Barrientosiimonas marina]|uniref:Membrane protein YkvI n=1 Tax=Lentibacillus kimchii TaxID=1542911 RepID=A0ABW2URI4_9BACI